MHKLAETAVGDALSGPCLQDGDGSPEEVASLIQELLEDKRELLEECFGIQVSGERAMMLLLRQQVTPGIGLRLFIIVVQGMACCCACG